MKKLILSISFANHNYNQNKNKKILLDTSPNKPE